MIKTTITLSLVAVLIALTCVSFADQPVPAVPETQGLVTSTGADVVGMATETDVGAWTLTNSGSAIDILSFSTAPVEIIGLYPGSPAEQQLIAAGGSVTYGSFLISSNYANQVIIPESILGTIISGSSPPNTWGTLESVLQGTYGYSLNTLSGGIHTGVLNPNQVQYTTAYDANILAQSGHTVLVKGMNINTGNKVAATQSNLKANTLLTYIATADGGNVVGSENLLIDGAGNSTSASARILCPFASQPVDVIPAYCNIVQTGNAYDLTVGTVSSAMSDRFVGTDAMIPVQLDQTFGVSSYGTTDGSIPAIGSTSAYIKAHIQESRGWNNVVYYTPQGLPYTLPGSPLKAEDLQYSETSSASGVIQQFTKVIHYQSGKSLMP